MAPSRVPAIRPVIQQRLSGSTTIKAGLGPKNLIGGGLLDPRPDRLVEDLEQGPGVLTGLVIWGFYWRIQGESGVNLMRSGPLRAGSDALGRLPLPAAVLVVGGGLIAFVAITSTVGYVLSFWNFRLVRHDGGTLQVTRGLLTARATSIERRRPVCTASRDNSLSLSKPSATATTVAAPNGTAVSMPASIRLNPFACCK